MKNRAKQQANHNMQIAKVSYEHLFMLALSKWIRTEYLRMYEYVLLG